MLQDVPDYAQRRRLLEGLKNRLEALLSPKIVAAFNNHSLGNILRTYAKLGNKLLSTLFVLFALLLMLPNKSGTSFQIQRKLTWCIKRSFSSKCYKMICKNCKWKLQIAENLRMLERGWNSTEIWNSEEFLTLTSRIRLLDWTDKLKWTGKVWLWFGWK